MQPGFQKKTQLLREFTALLSKGISLNEAATTLASSPGKTRLEKAIASALAQGASPAQAFRAAGFNEADTTAIEAASRAGQLPATLDRLASHYDQLAQFWRDLLTRCAYPVFLVHLAALLLPLPSLFTPSGIAGWLLGVLTYLGTFYLVFALVWVFISQSASSFQKNPHSANWIRKIPVWGISLEQSTGARFASLLSLLIQSGAGILKSLELAGSASQSALLRLAAQNAIPAIRSGQTLSEALVHQPGVPDQISRALLIGEKTGRLDTELAHAAAELTRKSNARIQQLSEWLPRLIFLVIALSIGAAILNKAFELSSEFSKALHIE